MWPLRLLVILSLVFAPQFLFSHRAAADTVTASDDFNRANGGLGPNWTAVSDGGMSISSQQVVGMPGATTGDIRTGETYGSDQFSQVEVTSTQLSGGQWIGPAVRLQNGGQDGYAGIYFWNFGSPQLMLFVRHGGSWHQLGNAYPSGALAAGTQLQVAASGNAITLSVNGVQRIAATDGSVTGGAPGIMTHENATADNWTGGAASPASAGGTASYPIKGTVSGLSGTVVLQDNGGDDLSVSADGGFTFATPVADGAAYQVTVKTNPTGQACTVSGGSGTVSGAAVTSVAVSCADNSGSGSGFQVTYASTDAQGVKTYDVTSADDGPGTQTLRVLNPTNPAAGMAHNFLIVLPVEAGEGTTFGDGMTTMEGLNAQNQYNLTIIEPSFAIDPWYANNPTNPNIQYETLMTQDLVPWIKQNLATTGHEQTWLIGFSKSGLGAQDLILNHPDLFTLAASWDFPADMSYYDQYGSAAGFGTDQNFQSNYRLTQPFVDARKTPFLNSNRIWIGGYKSFQADVSDYDALLTSEGIKHMTEPPQQMTHSWDGGWVPIALAALAQDSKNLP